MKFEYVCPKVKLENKRVKSMQIFFRNGDFFEVLKKEIAEISVDFYDELATGERGFCPVAHGGFIKLKISEEIPRYDSSLLYSVASYRKDRKRYLEDRCVNEGGICYFRLFDSNSFHYPFYAEAISKMDGDYLVLEIQPRNTYGDFTGECYRVKAPDVTKRSVEKIDLSFENCDGIEIFKDEIVDMQIRFKKELCWGSSSFQRSVSGGFIRLRLNGDISYRRATVDCSSDKITVKNMTRRICYKGKSNIDICHLYVTYSYAGYCLSREECLSLDPINPEYDCDDIDGYLHEYVSGYAKKDKDGSILIIFGESLEG